MRAGRGRAPGGFHALRRLGQNFLVDRGVLAEIVERSGAGEDDVVLEVGPGQGVLTRALLERGCLLHAVELDERLQPELEALAATSEGRLRLHWGDALRTDFTALSPFPSKVIANIPYSITTPLIWRLLTLAPKGLAYCLLMVQKEAADRLLAPADTRERYPLGATLEVMGRTACVRHVPPCCFRPVPRVESALVEIRVERRHDLLADGLWSELLHRAFAHRRKTLQNNLKGFKGISDWGALLREAGVAPGVRAEDVSGPEWLLLCDLLRGRVADQA